LKEIKFKRTESPENEISDLLEEDYEENPMTNKISLEI
jgi:hypothetical protein